MINHLPTQKNQQIPLIPSKEVESVLPPSHRQVHDWQKLMADAITDLDELLEILQLSHIRSSLYEPTGFKLRVPRGFIAKMTQANPCDPLLLQILPKAREQVSVTGYVADPLAENAHNPIQGLLHKYKSRVLVTLTGACAVHCRYCFRQHFDYQANLPSAPQIRQLQDYILAHPEIEEVIFSGGDPLSISNRRLFIWLEAFESLSQIRSIRLHTRLPIVIPQRLDEELIARLSASRCNIVMVLHTNHANEIDAHTASYIHQAKVAGVTLLNQAVLLAGINDSLASQVELSQRLFSVGVLPYYLHLLDKVDGAAHFDILRQQAVTLYWQMLESLPGYLVPKLVQEIAGQPFKTPVDIYNKSHG